ncbi:pyridoxamine 5'-phosphate oxidase family protein [Dongia sedimenti]|uniref:Pyridoxamine 5'-phosphate oxidase family protein n=1 Tax=Dongia sedimenti TaxID=3064282 RepID=A0ABU0YV47_9PROT|nr:pyridoxamine 5'-phosphate oxidase family protein [Rhodospirillaceae bacterium R-7]
MTFEEKQFVTSLAELDAIVPPPGEGAAGKTMHRIERYARQFIGLSPFCCLATSDGKGHADVTPRGDKPGFVRVLDDNTLLIPERPGNNRMDSLRNIIQYPSLGLLFFIPGFEDTLRVNGRGRVTRDPGLLADSAVDGRLPKFGVLVAVDEAFFHCAKAFRRSRLWDPTAQLARNTMPTLARMIMDQMAEVANEAPPAQAKVAAVDAEIEADYRTQLY